MPFKKGLSYSFFEKSIFFLNTVFADKMCPEGVISAGDIEEVVNYMVPVLQRREGELTIQEYSSYCFYPSKYLQLFKKFLRYCN